MQLNLISLLGLVVMIALAWACSLNRRRFPWRTVLAGLALQFGIALFILETTAGEIKGGDTLHNTEMPPPPRITDRTMLPAGGCFYR